MTWSPSIVMIRAPFNNTKTLWHVPLVIDLYHSLHRLKSRLLFRPAFFDDTAPLAALSALAFTMLSAFIFNESAGIPGLTAASESASRWPPLS